MAPKYGLSFKETATVIASVLEVAIHTILCIRGVYPPTTFARRRAHGVACYQSRSPVLREYISTVIASLAEYIERGELRRVTLVIKSNATGLPIERYLMDFGYMSMDGMNDRVQKETRIANAPDEDEVSLLLRGFLVKLSALDSQLDKIEEDATFAIIWEGQDESNESTDPSKGALWVPAMQIDTLNPNSTNGRSEPLVAVKAIETGVIDMRMMVQECIAKGAHDLP